MIERLARFCENPWRIKGLGLHIFDVSKICMKGYRLVWKHIDERQMISPIYNRFSSRFNPRLLPFYFNYEYTYITHPRGNTEMHVFADDIVRLGDSMEDLNERLETWRQNLETHGFHLCRSKTRYMECNFNKGKEFLLYR